MSNPSSIITNETITIVIDGNPYVLDRGHINADRLIQALEDDDWGVIPSLIALVPPTPEPELDLEPIPEVVIEDTEKLRENLLVRFGHRQRYLENLNEKYGRQYDQLVMKIQALQEAASMAEDNGFPDVADDFMTMGQQEAREIEILNAAHAQVAEAIIQELEDIEASLEQLGA